MPCAKRLSQLGPDVWLKPFDSLDGFAVQFLAGQLHGASRVFVGGESDEGVAILAAHDVNPAIWNHKTLQREGETNIGSAFWVLDTH